MGEQWGLAAAPDLPIWLSGSWANSASENTMIPWANVQPRLQVRLTHRSASICLEHLTGTAQCQMPGPPPGRRWQKTLDLPSFTWRLHAVQMADGWAGPWSLMRRCVQVSRTLWKVSSVFPRLLLERQGGLWVKMGNWWGGPAFLTTSPSSWVRSHQHGSTWTCQLQTSSSEGAGPQEWHHQWHAARRAVPSAQEGLHGKQGAEHQVTGPGQIWHCRLLAVTVGRWISLHLCFFLFAKIRTPTSHRCNY